MVKVVQCSQFALGSWLITMGNGATLGLYAGLSCWQIENSAVALARSALVSASLLG